MKITLLIIGSVLALLGVHWVGQGTGLFVWPANPAMVNHFEWAVLGGWAAALGASLMWFARWRLH